MPHIFISYVRENHQKVDQLCHELRQGGADVWLDREQIHPGERWQDSIREAIQGGAYFLACFSKEYLEKDRSYMNEELLTAIEELRKRPANRTWFIPVLLSECKVPSNSIGGGQTLQDIQWVELYSNWTEGLRKILDVIRRTVRSRFIRSPWLGIQFWQGTYQNPLLDDGKGVVRVLLQPKPFEIRVPKVPAGGSLRICTSYDPIIFSQVGHDVPIRQVPYFWDGKSFADTAFGSGQLLIDPDANMYFDLGGRLEPSQDGGGRILVTAVYKFGEEPVSIPTGRTVFAVMHVGTKSDPILKNWNFERFVLAF